GLAVSVNWSDPGQPWWSLGATLAGGAVMTALGLARRSQPYAFISTLLAGLAVLVVWTAPTARPSIARLFGSADAALVACLECLVLALTVAGAFWLGREIASQVQANESFDPRPAMPRVHAAIAVLGLPSYCLYRLLHDGLPLWFVSSIGSSIVSVLAT